MAVTATVGQGATYRIGPDCYPVTVCCVEEGGRRIGVWFDRPARSSPAWREPDRWFVLLPRGVFQLEGRRFGELVVGERVNFRDPEPIIR
jgi:hypothetical protein